MLRKIGLAGFALLAFGIGIAILLPFTWPVARAVSRIYRDEPLPTDHDPRWRKRALVLADYAAQHSLSLEESVAYADSASDLAMLEAVGFPVAVNPESRLSAIARRRGWHVEHWSKAQGGSHRPLPLGPFDVKSPKAVIGK